MKIYEGIGIGQKALDAEVQHGVEAGRLRALMHARGELRGTEIEDINII